MAHAFFINAVIFLVIIAVCLGFMFGQPVTKIYTEVDGEPGFTKGDVLMSVSEGWQIEAIRTYPNYFGALVAAMLLATLGAAYSLRQWERERSFDALQSKSDEVKE